MLNATNIPPGSRDGRDGQPICDPAHGGFYKQVRGAGEHYNPYRDNPNTYRSFRPCKT